MIRPYQDSDRQSIVDIYNHYIANTAFTFDTETISTESRAKKFAAWDTAGAAAPHYPCYVALADEGGGGEQVIGYAGAGATASLFRDRAAYHTTAEVSIYLAPDFLTKGIGSALYHALLPQLTHFHSLIAGITQPNDASNALHKKWGFQPVGLMREVGYKFNRYWDVLWYQKVI